jgi:hypothetical protein
VPRLIVVPVLVALAAVVALAHPESPAPVTPRTIGPNGCSGDPIVPTQVIEGEFVSSLQGAYVMVPFDVPEGTTQVRVKYCWDEPEGPTTANARHTVDLGLWQPGPEPSVWGPKQFRGWGGSSHPDVSITPQGFSSEAQYLARPRGHVPGRTTRGFVPGPIPAGTWAAELGVGGVVSQADGDADGRVRWRVEIALSADRAFAAERYRPAKYDRRARRRKPGWYAGDLHVHGEHSALGDATMTEVFEYAFRPLAAGGAGLDFVTLSDYVTTTGWGEIGRHQKAYPDRLIIRSAEIITYRGHANNHTSARYVDHRTGPVYLRHPDGTLDLLRAARPASELLAAVRDGGGFTQLNHPRIWPPSTPIFGLVCRGCYWSFSDAETDLSLVDAIEIQTSIPNPWTRDAIAMWEDALDAGHHIAPVGVSDSHHAGRTTSGTQTPIGRATTVVYARRLSERGIRLGIRAAHTYVKLLGNDGPDLRLEARTLGRKPRTAIMGDTLRAGEAEITAQVLNAVPDPTRVLLVYRDRQLVQSVPVTGSALTIGFRAQAPARYRLQLERGTTVEGVTSPIWLEAAR